MTEYQQTLDWLFSQLPMYQRVGGIAYKADLSQTHKLMELLGSPEKGFKSIHVGGTNGKGSVSHMLASIFQEAGYKTGIYTSPHLLDFRERIRINGVMIPEEKVIEFVNEHKSSFADYSLSFFEMTVGLAFDYFRNEKVDIAIIEVGLGGRLDSTNVIQPELSVITNISLDHQALLGNSLEEIATEKAGIIKPNTPIIIGEQKEVTGQIFKAIAEKLSAPIFITEFESNTLKSDLKGDYQVQNITTTLKAVEILETIGYSLSDHLDALRRVTQNTGLRGRWEILSESPQIICDTAHNFAGVKQISAQLQKTPHQNLHIVWGTVADKDISGILKLLPTKIHLYLCEPKIPRALPVEELTQLSVRTIKPLSIQSFSNVKSAIEAAKKEAQANDLIFIGGSTFIVAEALETV